MNKTKGRKKNNKKRSIKKELKIKHGGVSRRQMNQIENWKEDMSRSQKKKWGNMSYDQQYKAMRESIKRQKEDDMRDLSWSMTPDYEKKNIIEDKQNTLEQGRQYYLDNTKSVNKDFLFLKNKDWLYPYLIYLTTNNPQLANGKIEDCLNYSIDILNKVFRQNTYFSNQKINTNYKKEWVDCTKQSAQYLNCRQSKGFKNLWIPKSLKFNPYVEDIHNKNININNIFYSLSDLAGMSYTFLVYLPKISEVFRLIEAAHKRFYLAPPNKKPTDLFANLEYIDYCRNSKKGQDRKEE